jgi:tetratricopeptide (TPR) repeat protein
MNKMFKRWSSVMMTLGVCVGIPLNVHSAEVAQNTLQDKLKDVEYWSNLCNLQAEAGKFEEALASCEQAIALRPKQAILWADHSQVLLKLKKYPEAIASSEKALLLDPKTSLALTYKCMAFEAINRGEEALDSCNLALKLDGNWGRQSPALAWLHRGTILAQQSQHDQALVAFERTLLLTPKDLKSIRMRSHPVIKHLQGMATGEIKRLPMLGQHAARLIKNSSKLNTRSLITIAPST